MDLPPSKLSSEASRVWSENAGLHKKADPKIYIGLQSATMPSSTIENSTTTEKVSTSVSSGYVFGSRVFERVTKSNCEKNSYSPTANENHGNSTTNEGSKPLDVSSIFRRMAQKAMDNSNARMWKMESTSNGGGRKLPKDQLSESANELASKQGNQSSATAPDDQQPITTGEEEEKHLLQISCKFYHFNTESKQWQERGMGTLRVNQHIDAKDDIRLVGRQSGSQRVLINSKIFPEMLIEELSEKRLKISAHTGESDVPQLFLIQSSPASIVKLQNLLRFHIESNTTKVQMHQRESSSTRKRRITDEKDEKDETEDLGNGESAKKFLKVKQPLEREEKDENDEKDEENGADDVDEEEEG